MRIWHEKLIPRLCRKHLCSMWREGLGAYKIIAEGKKGYRNHPAVKEFMDAPDALWRRLELVRNEMISRGYHPKELPEQVAGVGEVREWQSLEQQVDILRAKGCSCRV